MSKSWFDVVTCKSRDVIGGGLVVQAWQQGPMFVIVLENGGVGCTKVKITRWRTDEKRYKSLF
jgi:hypothetical protein